MAYNDHTNQFIPVVDKPVYGGLCPRRGACDVPTANGALSSIQPLGVRSSVGASPDPK
jgi:hypothetical protein